MCCIGAIYQDGPGPGDDRDLFAGPAVPDMGDMMKLSDVKYCAVISGCIFLTASFTVLLQHTGIDPTMISASLPAIAGYVRTPAGFVLTVLVPGLALSIMDLTLLKHAFFGDG